MSVTPSGSASCFEHGLLRPSFVPPRPIRELRDLTHYRKSLVWERQREANRLQKLLEDANIKLASVATRTLGVSGRAMLAELCEGRNDPEALAELARGKLRQKIPELRRALQEKQRRRVRGRLSSSHEFEHALHVPRALATDDHRSFALPLPRRPLCPGDAGVSDSAADTAEPRPDQERRSSRPPATRTDRFRAGGWARNATVRPPQREARAVAAPRPLGSRPVAPTIEPT
jgi:Transposase